MSKGPCSPSSVTAQCAAAAALLLASACGLDALPPLPGAEETEQDFGVSRTVVVGAGGTPSVTRGDESSGGSSPDSVGVGGDAEWLPFAELPVVTICPTRLEACPVYAERNAEATRCVQDAKGYVFCREEASGSIFALCLHGHDGGGKCFPAGCNVEGAYSGDTCKAGENYCSELEHGFAPGTVTPCPFYYEPPSVIGIGSCERDYLTCFDQAVRGSLHVDECARADERCVASYSGCTNELASCDDDVSRCYASAEACFEKFGEVEPCAGHYGFCAHLAGGCVSP